MRHLLLVVLLLAASPALAAVSPRDGANHRLGDDSFVARFGRAPDAFDPEPLRMRVHLEHIRGLLADAPPTRPSLAARRAELLGYLDEYIAKGTTPRNTYVPHRSPVFIDAGGAICAVGYLIERSAGRALPEQIAAAHRTDYLEDIAAALPAVRAWVASSGFTLDELASIQPAYSEPRATEWKTWDLARYPQPDGAYARFGSGTLRGNRMEGAWKVTAEDGTVIGTGTLRRGAGTWTGVYPDGKPLAVGPYAANRAHGAWKLYHPSGHLAAEGEFASGVRTGEWSFYYDAPGKPLLARGSFGAEGKVTGTWRHYDQSGALHASAFSETPLALWGDRNWRTNGGQGFHLDVVARPGEVKHRIHQGTVGSRHHRLDSLSLGEARIYILKNGDETTIFDPDGHKLEQVDGAWTSSDCRWGSLRKRVAHRGDLAYLHGLIYKELRDLRLVTPDEFGDASGLDEESAAPRPTCRAPVSVPAARAQQLTRLLAGARHAVAVPAFIRSAALGPDYARDQADAPSEWELERERAASNLTDVLANGMTSWIEWPHIDALFERAFATMPGRYTAHWAMGDVEARDDSE